VRPKNKQSKTGIITVIFTLLIFILPLRGYSVNDIGRETLVLIGNKSLAPIVYNDNRTAKGVAVDIAKAIGDSIGYEVIVITENWEQAQKMVLNGEADGLLQINPNPERNELYDFSTPLLKSEFSMFVQTGNMTLRSIKDLENKIVGVEAGGYPNILLRRYEAIDIEIIHDWETSFKALSAERTAIFKAVSEGKRNFAAMAVVSDMEKLIYPCGICRQVIAEFKIPIVVVGNQTGDYKVYSTEALLPNAFTDFEV
jgi:cytidine deaminase